MRRVSPVEVSPSKALLIDVRTPGEYREAHIEGSRLHPLGNLSVEEIQRLTSDEQSCVLVCKSGKRASMAAEKLRSAGIKDLCILEGGVMAWDAAGLPLEHGKKAISIERQGRIVAGVLVVAGVFLGYYVHPAFFAFSGLIGGGLIFAGITDTCYLGMLLAKMPWNTGSRSSCCTTK